MTKANELSEPMKRAILAIGNLYWLEGIRYDTYRALCRRGLMDRESQGGLHTIGLADQGMVAYWEISQEQAEGGKR